MSISLLCFIFVILIGSATSAAVSLSACAVINTPGQYNIVANIAFTSQTTPCFRIQDPVTPGANNVVTINALVVSSNYALISCTNPAGCASVLKVQGTVMKVVLNYFRVTGKYLDHMVDAGNDCTVNQLSFTSYNASKDGIRCGSGDTTFYYNYFTNGYSQGTLLNAVNPSTFSIEGITADTLNTATTGMYKFIEVGGGTGQIRNVHMYNAYSHQSCTSPGYIGVSVRGVTNAIIQGVTADGAGVRLACPNYSGSHITKGIEVINSTGVVITKSDYLNFDGGLGAESPVYGIYVSGCTNTTISYNKMFRVQSVLPWGSDWDGIDIAGVYPIWVEDSVMTHVINNSISNTQSAYAQQNGNVVGEVDIHIHSQGGSVINNTVVSNYPGTAGYTSDSSPAGTCGDTIAFEIVDSSDIVIFQNSVSNFGGCFVQGDNGESAEGVVSHGGNTYGFYVQNSTGISLELNYVSTLNAGGSGYAVLYPAYGGAAVAYYLDAQINLITRNTASQITPGMDGSSGAGLTPQGPRPLSTEAYLLLGSCDSNMTASEMCFPSGTACCPSTCRMRPNTYKCREAAGDCDLADYCNFGQCTDTKKPNGMTCRPMNKTCDIVEKCNGVSNDCPADAYIAAGTPCTPYCGVSGTCTGTSSLCTTDDYCDQHCKGNANCRELTECTSVWQPGFYYITKDLSFQSECFRSSSSGITISGEGHTISCPAGRICGPVFNAQSGITALDFKINGTFGMAPVYCGTNCTFSNIAISNFTVMTQSQDPSSAMYITSGIVQLTNNIIDGGNASYGIYMKQVSSFSVTRNVINNVKTALSGVYIMGMNSDGSFSNNVISNIYGPVATQTCCGTVGTDLNGLYVTGLNTLSVINNTIQDLYSAVPCACDDAQADANTRSKGGSTRGIYLTMCMTNTINSNVITNIRGSNGFFSGPLIGLHISDMTAQNTVKNNSVTNLFGGNAEVLGNTSDIIGIWVNAPATVSGNVVSSIYGGSLAASNSSAAGYQGAIYGIKMDGMPANMIQYAYNISLRQNTITGFVGGPGANILDPSTATSTPGQSIYGIHSTNTYLSVYDSIISNLTSGPAGTSELGNVATPGSVVGLTVNSRLVAYSNVAIHNLTLGDEDSNATVDPSAPVAITQPVQVLNVPQCSLQNYGGDEFCFPTGNGCFRTCQIHNCALKVYGYSLQPSCTISDPSVQLIVNVYDSSPFSYGMDYQPYANKADPGNHTLQMKLDFAGYNYTLYFNDSYDCTVTLKVVVPPMKVPSNVPAPNVSFTSDGSMNITSALITDAADIGLLPITNYRIIYRTYCSLSTAGEWTLLPAITPEELSQGAILPAAYDTTYEVQVMARNCKYSSVGPSTIATSPVNPRPPTITQILPALGPSTAGERITIVGTNLPDSNFHVTIDGSQQVSCKNPVTYDANITECDVPAGVGVNHKLQIVQETGAACVPQATNIFPWAYAAPNITSISPLSTAGGALTIMGANFGLNFALQEVMIDENPCSECRSFDSGTVIRCTACPGGYEEKPLVVVVSGQPSAPFQFSYPKCTPVCMYGSCMANATSTYCQCLPGYRGPTCSEETVCEAPIKSRCGTCSSGKCCYFRSKM